MLTDLQATSQIYWIAALVAALIDIVLVGGLLRWLKEDTFRQLQPSLMIIAMIFWSTLYTWAANTFWKGCYQHVLPVWALRVVFPFGLLVGVLGFFFWWLSLRLPGRPLFWFIFLGGLHSLPGHLHAIYGRDMLERCPILVGVSPSSALIFGIFEFIFYWCVVLIITLVIKYLYHKN